MQQVRGWSSGCCGGCGRYVFICFGMPHAANGPEEMKLGYRCYRTGGRLNRG